MLGARMWVMLVALPLVAAACGSKGSNRARPSANAAGSSAGGVAGSSDVPSAAGESGGENAGARSGGSGGIVTGGAPNGGTAPAGGAAGALAGGAGGTSGGAGGVAGSGSAPPGGTSAAGSGASAADGGGAGAGPCVPRSCAELFLSCGSAVDNCGGALDCGGCPRGYECGVNGVPNVCGVAATATGCREGWCWTRRAAFAGDFAGVVGFAANDVWFAGAHGTLWHWNGSALSDASALGEHQRFADIWASGPGDLWIAAWDGIRRFDGTTWSREAVPALSTSNVLRHVWGSGTDVWAATSSSVFHREGGAWVQTGPSGTSIMNGWASSPDDVWVVGGTTSAPFVHRFMGGAWEVVDIGATTGYARAVTGTGPSDVYVVAGGALHHYDGNGWTELAPRVGAEPEELWIADGTLWAAGTWGLMAWDGQTWQPEEIPGGTELTGLWGTGSEMWVTGRWGTLLHRSSSGWTREAAAGMYSGTLRSVSASAADDVWVATPYHQVLHFDGARWTSLPDVFDCGYADIWVGARGRPWLAGDRMLPADGPCVVEWDGARWIDHSAGLDAGDIPRAIWGMSGQDVWVGGSPGLAHFDGQGWTAYESTMPILDIHGSASDRVAAVGVGVDDDELRWNGTSWTPVSTQLFPLLLSPHFVRGVWVSPTTYWVSADDGLVGRSGSAEVTPTEVNLGDIHGAGTGTSPRVWTFEDTDAGRVLERVDGSWRFATAPRRRNLSSVWATSETDAWIVGTGGLVHYDGARYSDVDGIPLWGLRGFSVLDDDDVWAAAGDFVAHWDGGDWTELFAGTNQIRAVYAADPEHVFAGSELSGRGELHRFDGQSWTELWSSNLWGVKAVHGFGPGDVWFAGDGSSAVDKIGHYDGTSVTDDFGGAASGGYSALFGAVPDDIWAGGAGVLVRYDGSSWTSQASPTASEVASIWGAASDDLWLVGGADCELYRFDGDQWAPQTLPDCSGVTFYQAWGRATDDVWFAGGDDAGARLLHFDDQGFSWEEVPYDSHLYAVAGSANYLWVGGFWDPLRKERAP